MLAPLQKIHVQNGCLVHYYEADGFPGSAIRVEQRIHGVDPKVSGEWKGCIHYPNALVVCVGQSLKDYTFILTLRPKVTSTTPVINAHTVVSVPCPIAC